MNAKPISISPKTSQGVTNSIHVGLSDAYEKRVLRSHRISDDKKKEDGDEKKDVVDEEERYPSWKIKDLIAGRTSELFKKWKSRGRTPDDIAAKMKNRMSKNDLDDLVRRYEDVYRPMYY
ncbi:RxLR effector protein [Phytophthora megakarya]|uniref:RxLR effector protein n=1 Tax=Phytophthora megakarya TaxID=4795 RepID=A0A225W0G0_9STRA|nr:RxLR effector protein [Phytophthora megakarya]